MLNSLFFWKKKSSDTNCTSLSSSSHLGDSLATLDVSDVSYNTFQLAVKSLVSLFNTKNISLSDFKELKTVLTFLIDNADDLWLCVANETSKSQFEKGRLLQSFLHHTQEISAINFWILKFGVVGLNDLQSTRELTFKVTEDVICGIDHNIITASMIRFHDIIDNDKLCPYMKKHNLKSSRHRNNYLRMINRNIAV